MDKMDSVKKVFKNSEYSLFSHKCRQMNNIYINKRTYMLICMPSELCIDVYKEDMHVN